MDTLWNDLQFALRMLRKSTGFTVVALLAIALGIGANTAIFSVVNAVLLRPLPFKDPSRLAMVWERQPRSSKPNVVNPLNFLGFNQRNRVFENMAAFIQTTVNLTGAGDPEPVLAAYVTRDFFPVLGIQPQLGRNFLPEEDVSGPAEFVLLSHTLWQRRYGSDPNIVGQRITINNSAATVVGVVPVGFRFPEMKAELWRLIHFDPVASKQGRFLSTIARLKPGIALSQAQFDIELVHKQLERERPEYNAQWGVKVVSLHENFVGDLRTPLFVLLGAVGLVLLIACANVANLMLMRSTGRHREIAIRSSLGATRGRIIRQLLVESTSLGAIGGALGLLLAIWGKDILLTILPESMSVAQVNAVSIDGHVLSFTIVLSLGTGLLFGLIPALRASHFDMSDALKEGGRGSSASLSRNRVRAALVVAEVATALVLLIGAGLLIRSLLKLENVSPGFDPDRLLTMRLGLTSPRYKGPADRVQAMEQIVTRVERLPGVTTAAFINWLPLSGLLSATGFRVDGLPIPKPGDQPGAGVSIVTPNYFRAMSIPLIKGRLFTNRDSASAPPVLLVNQTLARQFFPSRDPIGQRLVVQWGSGQPIEIIGVVGDVRHAGLDKEVKPSVFFPLAQQPENAASLIVRTKADPMKLARAVQDEIHSYDKDQAIAAVETMDGYLSKSVARPRFQSVLLTSFAALALLLASIGIFGVMSYSVAQRTHELGIRMALGAGRNQVVKLVVGQALALALAGTLAGLIGAFALTRFLKTLLFNVSATDPETFIGVSLLLCLVALLSSYLPARAATRIDPMVALRYE